MDGGTPPGSPTAHAQWWSKNRPTRSPPDTTLEYAQSVISDIGDPRENHRRAEQGQKSVGGETQRPRAWERSCRHTITRRPCPAPSLSMAGRSVRSDVGNFIEHEQRGRRSLTVPFPVIGGIAHVADGCNHERCELVLLVQPSRCTWCSPRTGPPALRGGSSVDANAASDLYAAGRRTQWTRCLTVPGNPCRRFRPARRWR